MPPFSSLDMHVLTLQMQDAHVFHELDYATPPRPSAASVETVQPLSVPPS